MRLSGYLALALFTALPAVTMAEMGPTLIGQSGNLNVKSEGKVVVLKKGETAVRCNLLRQEEYKDSATDQPMTEYDYGRCLNDNGHLYNSDHAKVLIFVNNETYETGIFIHGIPELNQAGFSMISPR